MEKPQHNRLWWEYFISITFMISGLIVLYVGKIEEVQLNKSASTLTKTIVSIVCTTKSVTHHINDIVGFQIVQKGKETNLSNTIRYKVVALMRNNQRITVKRSRSLLHAQICVLLWAFSPIEKIRHLPNRQ